MRTKTGSQQAARPLGKLLLPRPDGTSATFPNGKHDDQADSTSQALDWLKSYLFESTMLQYYRNEVIKSWRQGIVSWGELHPRVQKYIIDHNLDGPRPRGQQGGP